MKSISIKKASPRTLSVIRASFERSCEIIGLEKMGEVQTCMGLSIHGGGCLLAMALHPYKHNAPTLLLFEHWSHAFNFHDF